MKVDFSKFTNVVSGSMKTAKAELRFYSPNGVVREEQPHVGAAKTALSGIIDTAGMTQPVEKADLSKGKKIDDSFSVSFQFNPAALRISAYGGGMAPVTSYGSEEGSENGDEEKKGRGQVDYGPVDETVTVSFQVVFDAVKNEKVFPTDRVNPTPTNLAKQGVSLIRAKSYTVRPIVEGFLASVRNSSTRRVDFYWGSMHYGGYLNKVQCRYTLFDTEGEAVRAQVDLALVCSCHKDNDNQKEWRDRYAEFMKDRSENFSLSDKKWQSFFRAAVGRMEKACILFRAVKKDTALGTQDFEAPGIDGLSQMAALISEEALQAAQKKKADGAKETTAAEIGKEAADNTGMSEKVKKAGYVPVRVHYNPASITMYSRGGETVTREGSLADLSAPARFQRNAMPPETMLSMDLFFDDTDNANAFMLEAGMSSPTGMGRAVKNTVSRVKDGQCSVAAISELFVAATASAETRLVCFVWNKMVFWGELCEVEVEYTMFNNRGNPIRSKVSIRIRQDGDPEKSGSYEKLWTDAYHKLGHEAKELVSDQSVTGSSWNHIASSLFHI